MVTSARPVFAQSNPMRRWIDIPSPGARAALVAVVLALIVAPKARNLEFQLKYA
jgi:hypothetical protein